MSRTRNQDRTDATGSIDRKSEIESTPDSDLDTSLASLREQIDAVDREILDNLNRRARLVEEVGHIKSGGERSPIYVASRERDLVAALIESNRGPFPNSGLVHVFREIISATRSLEKMVSVSYLGPEGTFSHLAALRQFGNQVDLQPSSNLSQVFLKTERGETHFGVVPIENSTEGAVTECFDNLVDCGRHHLWRAPGRDLSRISCGKGRRSRGPRAGRLASPAPGPVSRDWLQRHGSPTSRSSRRAAPTTAAQMAAGDPFAGGHRQQDRRRCLLISSSSSQAYPGSAGQHDALSRHRSARRPRIERQGPHLGGLHRSQEPERCPAIKLLESFAKLRSEPHLDPVASHEGQALGVSSSSSTWRGTLEDASGRQRRWRMRRLGRPTPTRSWAPTRVPTKSRAQS